MDEIRELRPEEWSLLRPIFAAEAGMMPREQGATAIVCMDEKGLAGFWTLQPIWWAGPLWIREDRRGTGLWRKLNAALDRLFTHGHGGYHSFSNDDRMTHVFETLGYKEVGYRIFKKEV